MLTWSHKNKVIYGGKMERENKLLSQKNWTIVAYCFFVFMMIYNLLHSSPWGDEWIEYVYSQKNISDGALYRAIISTFQPPLYNLLMHFWLELGTSILWFRLFNVILGGVSGIFLYLTIKKLTNSTVANITLVMLSVCYQWIYCIQECSEYALMLMFEFGAFYFYTKYQENMNSLKYEIIFVFMCIGAMYSQYGAFFFVAPLLLFHLMKQIKYKNKANMIRTISIYGGSLVLFAFPLYYFFARIQIGVNEISEHAVVVHPIKLIKDFFMVFGGLLKYVYNIMGTPLSDVVIAIAIILLFIGIILSIKKSTNIIVKEFIFIFITAYILFVILVSFQIYAMVHPNQSAGYYSRYAYFFIPLMSIIIPTIVFEFIRQVKNIQLKKISSAIIVTSFVCIGVISFPMLLNNWHKAYDDEFIEIWYNNAGFTEDTYLNNTAKLAFNYYTSQKTFKLEGNIHSLNEIDYDNLPDIFWAWRTSWGGDGWQEIVDYANNNGYDVVIYADYGSKGQLARCEKKDK